MKQHSQPPVVDNGEAWVAECGPNDAWDKPGPAYRVYGATYYVGTCGIASILIAGDDGHILIDGGTQRGGPMIAANIASLGFNVKDVKILLHSHEHFDHVGGLAFLQAESGARVIASTRSAPVLQSGVVAANDPQSGMHDPFAGVSVDATISHAEQVTLGTNTLTAFETPGHSPGALSWQWTACEADQCKTMVYIDSLSPISRDGYQFMLHPVYVAQYRAGLAALTGIECDFALTPHPVASAMHQRLSAPGGLEDENGCRDYIDRIKRRLDRRLVDEHAGSGA
ncbi:MAG: subclass B3 metallo-beta-lactamase [Pseudomonadota bacterium]